jgi:serine/threonine protein kinase
MNELPVIPGFRIVRLLGQGGMADVYEAEQVNLDRKVAVKVIIPELFRDATFTARFVREAQTAARLNHPHILHIYNVGNTPNCYYIVMERLQESLKVWLKRGPLSPDDALDVMCQIGQALDYAHRKGIVHRDIKPDNIMFHEDGNAVLTDFGIAKAVDSTTKLTRTGGSVGTPHYMSPEQISGMDVDGRSDFYSLGIVFYEMLTGKVPYEATDPLAICMKHVHDPIPVLPASLLCFQPLLEGLLAKKPEQRISSGDELQKWINGLPGISSKSLQRKGVLGPLADPGKKTRGILMKTLAYSTRDQAALGKKKLHPLILWLAGSIGVLMVILWVVWNKNSSQPGGEVPRGSSLNAPRTGITQPQERPKEETGQQASMEEKQRAGTTKEGEMPSAQEPPRRRNEHDVQKIHVVPSSPSIISPNTILKRIGLFELDPQLALQYGQQFNHIHVAGIPENVNAFGQIAVLLNVDGAGRISIDSLDCHMLTVEPPEQQSFVKKLLSQAVAQVRLLPPWDRDGHAVILEKWRLSFKIVTLTGKMTLIKQ